ncbi:MAG: sensor histidine kinase [Balneolaceae bacterium]
MENPIGNQSYTWQPLSLDYLLSSYKLTSSKTLVAIGIWVFIIAGSLVITSDLVSRNWFSLTSGRVELINFFTLNPPLIFGLLLVFWFGFEWGFIPVYLCSFMIAFYSQMTWGWALLVGFSFVMGIAIYALAYQSLAISYTLRSFKSIVFFITISFIAALASSMGSFIWSFFHQLSAEESLIIWKSWWTGIFFQSILIGGPAIFLFSPGIERLKRRFFEMPPVQEVSLNWIYGSVLTVTATLALFIFSGNWLGKMRVREVAGEQNLAAVSDIVGALEAFEIISWTSIGLIIITGFTAIYLLGNWNRQLSNEIENRTEELNQSEKKLKRSLTEKQILLQEIHHRVKNNLAQVHALLELQEQTDKKSTSSELLQVSRSRIRSMAFAHEALYKNKNLSRISMQEYFTKIIKATHHSFKVKDKDIELSYKFVDTELEMAKAIPLGLILNEVIINAHKHAFQTRDKGEIEVRTITSSGDIKLIIRDNGQGISTDINPQRSKSLGMLLIRKFTQQISGELDIQSDSNGTSIAITFPV